MKVLKDILISIILLCLMNCNVKKNADLIITNARIYTVDSTFSVASGVAIKDGKFIEVGNDKDILSKYTSDKILDLKGKYVFPGFHDGHCHFYGFGTKLLRYADLQGTTSFNEVLDKLKEHAKKQKGLWLVGMGWDQNDWEVKEFPDNEALDSLFPDRAVMIIRIDGHAVLANSLALQKTGITNKSYIPGGEIERKKGKLTGILIDNAADSMKHVYGKSDFNDSENALLEAQKRCLAVGLTSITDAGQSYHIIRMMDSLQELGLLKMRIDAMISPSNENIHNFMEKGDYKTDRMHVCAIKLYADGAMGSRGALLTKPYDDIPDTYGILVTDTATLIKFCKLAYKYHYQACTHAIGDSAVKLILDIYSSILKGPNDLRWRIEHAQVVDSKDFSRFGTFSIIPSVQTTHATSDMYWAAARLGDQRIKNAYAYKKLLDENHWLINGTDFPIEHINPLYSFYAAITRKDLKGWPENGFQMENALNRDEALKAMTIWPAKGSFDERQKGSIEPGKWADFVVLDEDIMSMDVSSIPEVKVIYTFIGGEKVYQSNN